MLIKSFRAPVGSFGLELVQAEHTVVFRILASQDSKLQFVKISFSFFVHSQHS